MSVKHDFPVDIQWSGGFQGVGTIKSDNEQLKVDFSVPTNFKGKGLGTNPEELLTSAVAGCYSITFGIMAESQKLPLAKIEVNSKGEVEHNGVKLEFKSITLKPKVYLDSSATDSQKELAENLAHKADEHCLVSNALSDKVSITVEPEIIVG